jgi:hypothetical protein
MRWAAVPTLRPRGIVITGHMILLILLLRGSQAEQRPAEFAGLLARLEHFQEKWNPVFRPKRDNAKMLSRSVAG